MIKIYSVKRIKSVRSRLLKISALSTEILEDGKPKILAEKIRDEIRELLKKTGGLKKL